MAIGNYHRLEGEEKEKADIEMGIVKEKPKHGATSKVDGVDMRYNEKTEKWEKDKK